MNDIKSVLPDQAQTMLHEGWVYVDVRSEQEFEAGHPPGALNVPLLQAGPLGMTPNPEFLAVMQQAFGRHEKLLLGCRSGGRSRRAAELLQPLGFTELADLVSGWEGGRDAFGRPLQGWVRLGLPVEHGAPGESAFAAVKRRAPR